METITVKDWHLADEIKTKEDVIGILEAAFEENDMELFFEVLSDISRSEGMAQLTRELDRADISAKGSPSIATVFTALDNLGFHFKAERKTA
jgi:probable addiction module antidote protein